MTSRDFCYWLQGFYELHGPGPLDAKQSECVAKHLAMVFKHEIDPSFGADEPALNAIHTQTPAGPGGGGGPGNLVMRC